MTYQAGLLKLHIQHTGFKTWDIHVHVQELLQIKERKIIKERGKGVCEIIKIK